MEFTIGQWIELARESGAKIVLITSPSGAPGRDEGGEGGAAQQEGKGESVVRKVTKNEPLDDKAIIWEGSLTAVPPSWAASHWDVPAWQEGTDPPAQQEGTDDDDDSAWLAATDALVDRLVEEKMAHLATSEERDSLNKQLRDSLNKQIDDLRATVANLTDSGIEKDNRIAAILKELNDIQVSKEPYLEGIQRIIRTYCNPS